MIRAKRRRDPEERSESIEAAGESVTAELPRPRMGARELVSEAVSGLLARPGRTALTMLGTLLGIGALVATLGVAETAGNQIVRQFDTLTITEVTAEPRSAVVDDRTLTQLPWDAEDRVSRLNGVDAVGTRADVDVDDDLVSSVPVRDPTGGTEHAVSVVAASPGLFDAVVATWAHGRAFDAGHDERADPVVVLGPGPAERLGITRTSHQPAILLGDRRLSVIGILDEVGRSPDLLNAIIVPQGYARERLGLASPQEVRVDTQLGAADVIAEQLPLALDPDDPETIQVSTPPSPGDVRGAVESDVDALFLILGAVALLVGALGIANVTLVSVLERTAEIGVRRALGAARRHIAAQFLLESTALGFLGGVAGASLGVLVVVGTAAAQGWTPVLALWVPLAAPLVGTLVGLLAGLYPALRAASLEPLAALRAEA